MSWTVTRSAINLVGGGNTTIQCVCSIPAGATVGVLVTTATTATASGPGTCVDNNSVSYTAAPNQYVGASGVCVGFYSINAAAATQVNYTLHAGDTTYGTMGISVYVLTPTAGVVSLSGSAGAYSATWGAVANAITTGNMGVTSTDAIVIGGITDITGGNISAGTVPLMVQDQTDGGNVVLAEHYAFTTGANTPCTWSTSAGTDQIYVAGLAFSLTVPVVPYGDGSSSGATSAATGTNGQAMSAIVAGNQLDVIVHITNSTVPTAMTISDGHNTYNAGAGQFGSIDVFNDSGNGQIWYRFRCSVTVPLTTPVITATAQAGYFPTNMSVFAGILTGIATGNPTAPLTAANVAHSSVITGPNQVSGFTPALAAGPGINYTASAFAMDVGASFPVGAPTAGNNFTQIATAWAFISSGGATPTLLWETMAIPSGGSPIQATAVYQSGRPYTLLAVFNNLAGAINPAGPMPRQLYIMP